MKNQQNYRLCHQWIVNRKCTKISKMLCLKKVYTDELLQIAILLSLLRVDRNSNLGYDYDVPAIGVGIDDIHGWDQSHTLIRREIQVHPKNLDSILLNYEQQLFDDLNSLGRYNRINSLQDVTAYLLNIDGTAVNENSNSTTTNSVLYNRTDEETPSHSVAQASSNNVSSVLVKDEPEEDECSWDSGFLNFNTTENLHFKSETDFNTSACLDECVSFKDESSQGDELTQEDMNLIEVLWKQDVDMGFTMSTYQDLGEPEECPAKVVLKHDAGTGSSTTEALDEKLEELNPWEGLSYTIDLETGEYVLKSNLSVSELSVDEPPSSLLQETDYSLEDAFQLVSLNEENFQLPDSANIGDEVTTAVDTASIEEASGRSSETSASFSLVSLDEDSFELPDSENISTELGDVVADSPDVSTLDADQQLDLLTDMIQTPQFHARPFQGRVPYMRTMSMEQRWQDLANLLSLPDPNHPYHHFHHPAGPFPTSSGNSHSSYPHSGDTSRNVLLHNATLAPPVGDLNSSSSYPNLGGASNIGSAVATSMNLTNSSEPMGSEHGGVSFKIENPHDVMYYQNGTSEMNHTTDGFLSSILNDEDLQLMDMAMNEGMYTMRMLEGAGNGTVSSVGSSSGALSQGAIERGTDSDSAVSSMGSERVPSLSSDTEWMETNSDSGHTPADHYADYHGKFRWCEYASYTGRQHSMEGTPASGQHRMPSVAQKKHHMYGKRYFQEQGIGTNGNNGVLQGAGTPSSVSAGKFEFPNSSESGGNTYASSALGTTLAKSHPEMKYSCSVEFTRQHLQTGLRPPAEHVAHNHTYHLPPEHTGTLPRPVARDKQKGRRSEEEHVSRDEKRARSLNIPMTVSDIINLPMDEFNERLSKYDLSESQLSLIRDIRRRGKNKVAAQNCRKRKLDQIMSLADEVKQMRERKQRLIREREFLLSERQRIKNKFTQLYRHIFQALRDADGNPYSPYEWSLQQSADGSVLLVPRSNATSMLDSTDTRSKHKDPDPRTQPRKP